MEGTVFSRGSLEGENAWLEFKEHGQAIFECVFEARRN